MDKDSILALVREVADQHGVTVDEQSLLLGFLLGGEWWIRFTASPERLRLNLEAYFAAQVAA